MSRKRDITMLQKQIFQLNLEFKIGYIGWFPLLNAHYISRGPKLTMSVFEFYIIQFLQEKGTK